MTPDNISDDDDAVNPVDKDHASIFWVNCYTHTCEDHAREKVENATYPLHMGPVLMLYWDFETQAYRLQYLRDRIATLQFIGEEECWEIGILRDCKDPHCEVHLREKVREWHET